MDIGLPITCTTCGGPTLGTDIEHEQNTRLDRVLGRNNEVATNDIAEMFDGLITEDSLPASDQPCEWVEPSTGKTVKFPLQHAVDFTYFVDGGRRPVPDHAGPSFCIVPIGHSNQDITAEILGPEEGLELFDPFLDDDSRPQDVEDTVAPLLDPRPGSKRHRDASYLGTERDMGVQVEPQQRRRVTLRSALDTDALIVEKLGDDPDLLERFLDIWRNNAQTGVTASRTSEQAIARNPSSRRRKPEHASKYAFTPQPDQQYVHEQVTSEKHRCKTPHVFISGLVRSDAVKFKALSGICTRAFDIRFGSKGLPIRHFAKLTSEERVAWLQSGGSNFDNLSATAEFAKATPAASIEKVVDSIKMFMVELIGLTEAILRFTEETLMRVSRDKTELPSVVYWINDVLEDFREAILSDSDVTQVQLRYSSEDRLLRDLMFVKLHRQVDALKQSKPIAATNWAEGKRSATRQPAQPIRDNSNRHGRIPKNVLKSLPVYIDPATNESQALCMRFLSTAECQEDEDGCCPSDRGHFVPKALPEVTKADIRKRFGGLKTEYNQL
ncbi:hypothetical protein P3T76_010390 [Phytophthora citrophthora]|uniref:Uncharacterized protein n=1 Tax=Phytophthora citrophthora TaxID=4793 RepID=A0AAD9GC94_9STRA|nr:hypothetical protein P3T76_010390 [Phytophthora citrophthora]